MVGEARTFAVVPKPYRDVVGARPREAATRTNEEKAKQEAQRIVDAYQAHREQRVQDALKAFPLLSENVVRSAMDMLLPPVKLH